MNQNETATLVDFVAASDSRNVTEQTYAAWHVILGHLDFDLARQAAVLAMRDETIRWTEPKHIIAKVAKLIEAKETEERRARAMLTPTVEAGTPQPLCRQHNKAILSCNDCCRKSVQLAKVTGGNNSRVYVERFYSEIALSPASA